jgi:hypothetical protein
LKARGKEDAATADLLAKDPRRYLEKPEKEEKDKKRRSRKEKEAAPAVEKPPVPEMASEKGPKCGFSKRLVAKDKSGVERCFEEGRAANGKFNLVDPADCFGYGGAEDEGDVGDGDSDEDYVEMDMGTSTGSAAAPLAIYESPASNDLTPSGNATPRRIFGPDQAGLEEPAERASHVKQKVSADRHRSAWASSGSRVRRVLRVPPISPSEIAGFRRRRTFLCCARELWGARAKGFTGGGLPRTTPERNSPLPPQKDTPWLRSLRSCPPSLSLARFRKRDSANTSSPRSTPAPSPRPSG